MAICAFCGTNATLNHEHLFPDWLRQALPPATKSHYTRRKGDGSINSWLSFSHNTTAQIACQTCNGGWMSQVEGAAAPLLLPKILDGTPGTLAGQQLASVAAWIYLKSLVIQRATAPDVASEDYYHDLFATHAPRPGTVIWLGGLNGIDAATGFFIGAKINSEQQGVPFSGYLSTIGVGALAARVLYVPPAVDQLGPVTNPGFDSHLFKIWSGVDAIAWPPPTMNFAAFAAFNKTLPQVVIAQ